MKNENSGVLNSPRVDFIDIAKAFGIILVVYGHLPTRAESISRSLFLYIFAFHMPLFFILSGMTYSVKTTPVEFIKRRFHSLLLPYFLFYIFSYLCSVFSKGVFLPIDYFAGMVQGTLFTVDPIVLWFIPTLFLTLSIYKLIDFFIPQHRYGVIALCAIISFVFSKQHINTVLPWGINIACSALIFIEVGRFFKEKLYSKIDTKINYVHCLYFIGLFFIGIFSVFQNKEAITSPAGSVSMGNAIYGDIFLFLVASVINSFILISLSRYVTSKFLKFIGIRTMGILLFHSYLLNLLFLFLEGRHIVDIFRQNGILLLCFNIIVSLVVVSVIAFSWYLIIDVLYGNIIRRIRGVEKIKAVYLYGACAIFFILIALFSLSYRDVIYVHDLSDKNWEKGILRTTRSIILFDNTKNNRKKLENAAALRIDKEIFHIVNIKYINQWINITVSSAFPEKKKYVIFHVVSKNVHDSAEPEHTVQLSSLTDVNWENGIKRDDPTVLLFVNTAETFELLKKATALQIDGEKISVENCFVTGQWIRVKVAPYNRKAVSVPYLFQVIE